MRRTVLVVLSLLVALAFAGVAYAVKYKTGKYKAGSATGDGATLRIKHGKFDVLRVSFKETCDSKGTGDSFTERFAFVKAPDAKLKGKIKSSGRFHGTYTSEAGTVTVKGRVKGSKARVKASEHGSYVPAYSTARYSCHGSHTFKTKRVK
jgi:hypothetical protein